MTDRLAPSDVTYDVIGIGIGPFNLGLAALLQGSDECAVKALFFEQKPEFEWHGGMLIDGTTLQVPFMADLVTMADPTSPYSYLNYLRAEGRLYAFYFFEKFHIPRQEYNHYCQWVAKQLTSCQFGQQVVRTTQVTRKDGVCYEVVVQHAESKEEAIYYARHLVLGVGNVPHVGETLSSQLSETMFHSASYTKRRKQCLDAKSITVVGSGQSAAEIFYDLLKSQSEYGYELTWLTRSRGFFPMEYSKLGLEHFSPDYTSYFFDLPASKKDSILGQQHLLYKGISAVTIADIYDELYHATSCGKRPKISLRPLTEVKEVIALNEDGETGYRLSCWQWEQEEWFSLTSEQVILATGYRQITPHCLESLTPIINWDGQGRYQVDAQYRLALKDKVKGQNNIYIQNGELHTHGIGAPDLGLGAHRNATIINDLADRVVYPVTNHNVFQQFGVQ
ncbi:lysine N(6)-hydroxylase/L-ornithine N(5)-oxygenase family protein [Paenibacillus sp. GSMTC-2017]|uniref:lysine N(6)-hydroxylase/L-ornithine N(5)-oxygenase family protein n=1 Tax=Paenibacillus sp. GSMTC-2017 TaxID=2794350 RepID=UPI0018D67D01|nr:lysine N(6)-hydroxylase/L-ornithine N(5)-oxygenase family protein [Paenibacillus sp. GSMTC-2017]MBH5320104.1 lysine N(6)-hydroxylase/L-ornithine N(5)-oxygenase family protein [Paenibacillus sp. GSMTC-2017]